MITNEYKAATIALYRKYHEEFEPEEHCNTFYAWTPDGYTTLHVWCRVEKCSYYIYAYAPLTHWEDVVTLENLM